MKQLMPFVKSGDVRAAPADRRRLGLLGYGYDIPMIDTMLTVGPWTAHPLGGAGWSY